MQFYKGRSALVGTIRFLTVAMLSIAIGNVACAQMFGDRPVVGQGMLQGNERFLRGNRSPRDFVGSNRADQTSFVGSQQALTSGRVRPATEGFRLEATNPRRINRPIPPQPARGMYYPRLEVDWEPNNELNHDISARTSTTLARLEQRVQRLGGTQVQIELSGSTATLRGRVESGKVAELLEQLLRFEAGIDEVQNELQIELNQ